jgi:hypothetical protein
LDGVHDHANVHGGEGDYVGWVEEGDVGAVRVGDDKAVRQHCGQMLGKDDVEDYLAV